MNNTGGAIHFEITASNDDLKRKLAESRQALLDSGRTAEEQGSKIESMFKRAAVGAGVFFSAQQALQFAKQVAVVRGEFQQLEVSFSTLLQSKEKANILMAQMVELAAKTPFSLRDVAQGAKQLVAYGFAAEEVNDTMLRLGNVAAGLGLPMERLTYLYGTTMTQGRLYARDLMQFTTSGIPMLQGLADMFGVTTEEVNKMVSAGKVGFPEVKKVIENLTSEGGKFHGLMEDISKTITGRISNLGDAIDVTFNKMGQSQEGFISSVISGTTELVENYEAVGREIAALVVAYGVYKAAIISLAAIQKTVTTIKHTEEAAELVKLLTIEQQANISKLGLAKTSAEYAAAVKAEVMAEMERQTQLAVTTNAELEASRVRLASAEVSKKRAEEIVTAKSTELTSIIGTSKAEQIAVIEKKIAIESEKQSRSALEIVKLQGRKNDAIAQAQHLKEIGASAEKIAAKNREIAVIAEKIAVQRAEEIQHSRNVVALRAEIATTTTSVKSKSVLKAQSALLTAQTQLETAATARNAAALELSSQRAIVDSAVRKANTIETGINTAIKNANAKSSAALFFANFKLSAVTSKLSIVTKQATAAITKNPYVVAAVAVAALTYGIYKLCTAQSAAERAQEAFNEKIEEGKKKQDEFVSKTNELIGVIRTETNTRYMQVKAFKELNERFPDLLKNMSMEKLLLMDNLELQKLSAQYTDNQNKKGIFDGLDDAQQKVEAAKKAYDDYAATGGNISILEVGRLKNKIYEAEEYLKQWQNKLKEHRQIEADARPVDEKIGDLSQNITLLKKQLSEVEKLQEDAKKNNPFEWNLYEFKVGAINAQISAKQQELKALNDGNGTDVYRAKSQILTEIKAKTAEISALESKSSKSNKEIQELKKLREERKALESEFQDFTGQSLERKSKPTTSDQVKKNEARIEAERKLKEALVNMQFDTEQARIEAMADGLDKELAQIELNYTKKQTAIELWEREQRQIVVDAQKTTFISQGGKEQDFKVDGSDPAFAPINKSYDAKTAANNAEQTASNEKLLTDLKAQWQTWADDYQQIEDQITATRANADRDRRSIAATHKAGKIDSTEAMTATRKVDSGEQKQIANLESQKTKLSSSWEQVFRDLQGMSRSQVKILISEINDQLSNSELSPADHSALLEQLDKAKDYATTLNPFASFVDGINDVKTATELLGKAKQALEATKTTDTPEQEKKAAEQAVKKAEKALADTKKERNEAASKSLGDISGMASATSDLLKTFGVESPAVDGVVGALGSLASIDFSNAMSIITGGLGAIANLLGGIFGEVDKRKEQQIADIQRTVDSITESYDKLDKAIGKAYSNDAADLIGDEIKMREQQRGLIEQQKKIEESRKNPDNGALEGYDKAIDDINLKIEESKEAACDAIFGSDVQSAIDEFASAYMNSWASGEDRAQSQKDVVKNMLRGIIKEMLKADIKGSVEKMRKQIEGFMSDDVLSELELSQIDKMGDEIGHIMEERGKIYDKILKDDKPIDKDETSLSGQIRGTVATEQSVSELGGIFRGMADTGRRIEIGLDLGFKTVAEMARTQLLIEANTRRSADNTDGLTSKIDATNTKLDTLISKIKPDNGSY